MSVRPTGFPAWATQTSTGIVEPIDAKKRVGFKTGEEPASQYVNWLHEKESSWIRYLSYDWIINEDFITGPGPVKNALASNAIYPTTLALTEQWGFTGIASGGFYYAELNGFGDMGMIAAQSVGNVAANPVIMEKWIGSPNLRDLAFEAIVNSPYSGQLSRPFRLGTQTNEAYFSATGITNPQVFFINWNPSLQGITFMNLGVTINPSALQRLAYERVGQTMLVEVDGQSRAAFYAGNVNFTGTRVGISFTGSVTGLHGFYVDALKFGVRRT